MHTNNVVGDILYDIHKSETPTRKSYETKPVLQILTKNWFGGVCVCLGHRTETAWPTQDFLSDVHTIEGGLREEHYLFVW